MIVEWKLVIVSVVGALLMCNFLYYIGKSINKMAVRADKTNEVTVFID